MIGITTPSWWQTAVFDGDSDLDALLDRLFDPAVQPHQIHAQHDRQQRPRGALVFARSGCTEATETLGHDGRTGSVMIPTLRR